MPAAFELHLRNCFAIIFLLLIWFQIIKTLFQFQNAPAGYFCMLPSCSGFKLLMKYVFEFKLFLCKALE
jgi:hypothetical protein